MVVSMVVLGPKELPRYLRKAGLFAGKLRRFAYDMREKSGIDEVLRTEGLDRDIAEIRRLTRGELASLVTSVRSATNLAYDVPASPYAQTQVQVSALAAEAPWQRGAIPALAPASVKVDRAHEYPAEGADAYGALPDTAVVYEGGLPASPLAEDPLYARGEEAPSADGAFS